MPTELRHIVFRPAEVIQAVKEYYRRSRQPLPTGSVLSCAVETEKANGAIRFRIKIALDSTDGHLYSRSAGTKEQDILIETPNLAAALILYCNMRHVPLPARANKSLQRVGDQLALIVAVGSKCDSLAVSGIRI